jgi:hypothetical protein
LSLWTVFKKGPALPDLFHGLLNEQGRNDKWEGESAFVWMNLKKELFRQLLTLRDL